MMFLNWNKFCVKILKDPLVGLELKTAYKCSLILFHIKKNLEIKKEIVEQ